MTDTAGADMPFATVMLLSPKDSTLINFTRADDKGAFAFKNVKNTAYLLKASYVGYIPFQQHVPASTTEINDLGHLAMKPINTQLNEVVIKAARSTLSFKGDTIEYDASSFKVPPGATVEDLLRRLPGIEVDADGNIKAQGKSVQRVYVDGKSFFGDDPKAATQNLGAEAISKVQVYNDQSEQSKLTGVDDGKKEKAMNLELKEEYKKGSFGKITVAAGTEDRWQARGNYNRFNSKEQFSIIGYGNNINQTGVNWEDYGEFKGQNSFNGRDNGDFGFSTGGGGYYWDGNDEDIPRNFFDGRGLTKNYGSGVNYNFDNKKTKVNSSYFYNQVDLAMNQNGFRKTFLPTGSFYNTDTLNNSDFKGNHALAARLEHELDSNNMLIVKVSGRFTGNENQQVQQQLFSENDIAQRALSINNTTESDIKNLKSLAIFRHRFKKKGRSFALSSSYNASQTTGQETLASLNRFFEATTFTQQVQQLNQRNNHTRQWKASGLFTESFRKKWFWETFVNAAQTNNISDRQAANALNENARIDSLSVWFDNEIQYGRVGSSLRYSYNAANISGGVAGQSLILNGKYAIAEGLPVIGSPLSRRFNNFIPYLDFSYEFPNNVWGSAGYSYSVSEPQFNDLLPTPNVSNPAFRTEGNPNLTPSRHHNFNANVGFWNPANLSSLYANIEHQRYDNRITYSQTIEEVDSIGIRTTTRPENIDGGYRTTSYLWLNYPLIKTKLTLTSNWNITWDKSPAMVNGVRNETDNRSYNLGMGFNITPSPKIIVGMNGNYNYSTIEYSIQESQNQQIYRYNADVSVRWQMFSKTFLESNFTYQKYENARFGFSQELPILNASVRRLFGKENRVEMRLAAFDALNRRVSINQWASQNYVSSTISNTLSRYFMLSVSYNVRGYENKLKKNDWW